MRHKFPTAVFIVFFSLAAASTNAVADCASEFNELRHSNLAHSPYEQRMKVLVKDGAGKEALNVDMTAQIQFPDRLHLIAPNYRASGLTIEIIMVGDKQWLRRGSGWEEDQATDINDTLEQARRNGFLSGDISDIQCLGPADYESRKLLSFSYTGLFNGVPIPMHLYVDPATRLPVVTKGTASKDGLTFETETTFGFDSGIVIEAPKP